MTSKEALRKIKKGGMEDDDFGWLSNSYLYEKEIAIIEKELKALEIIKKFVKSIDLKYIFCGDLVIIILGDEFEYWYKCETQEEYDLLKEVLEK